MVIKLSVLAPRETPFTDAAPRAGPAVDATRSHFERAMQRFESGQWDLAFTELSELADRGHPAAARVALMLVCRGSSLFGGRFSASREQRARWQQQSDA